MKKSTEKAIEFLLGTVAFIFIGAMLFLLVTAIALVWRAPAPPLPAPCAPASEYTIKREKPDAVE